MAELTFYFRLLSTARPVFLVIAPNKNKAPRKRRVLILCIQKQEKTTKRQKEI